MRSFLLPAVLGLGALGITSTAQASWLSQALNGFGNPGCGPNYGGYPVAPQYGYSSYYGPGYQPSVSFGVQVYSGPSYYRGPSYGSYPRYGSYQNGRYNNWNRGGQGGWNKGWNGRGNQYGRYQR